MTIVSKHHSIAVVVCLLIAAGAPLLASTTAVTFQASGTFATPPVSGADNLKLAGEPFSVKMAVSTTATPYKSGPNYIVYNKQRLSGTVYSGLVGPTPVPIASAAATLELRIVPGQYDQITIQAPIKVVGISLTIKAVVNMPLGTITQATLQAFTAPVTMSPSNATLTYADSGASTELAIQSGTLTAQ